MMRRLVVGLAFLALSSHAGVSSMPSSSDALDGDFTDEKSVSPPVRTSMPTEPVSTGRVAPSPTAPARTPSANPLWGIPLTQLSGTRDRPIFSHSRRPAPAVVAVEERAIVRPPPRKKEIEPPQLALVGTIASGNEGFGIFIDQSTKAAVRLKIGEDFQGWKLLTIKGREVTMSKDERSAVLILPQPGGQDGEVRLVPVSAVTR